MISLIAFITLIGILITAHEFGHFIVAKLCKVKVHTFSIGFGRALLSKTIGETEYRIAILPLGGYVRLHGMEREFGDVDQEERRVEESDVLQGDAIHYNMVPNDAKEDPDAGRALQDKPAWMRVLIFVAGPAMNLLLPFILLPPLFMSASDYDQVVDHDMGAVDAGLPAYRAGLRDGDKILSIDGDPIYAFWQIQEKVSGYKEGGPPLSVTVKRRTNIEPLTVNLTPERVASTGRFSGPVSKPMRIGFQPASRAPDYVITDPHGSFSQATGRDFDRILSVHGVRVNSHASAIAAIGDQLTQPNQRETLSITVERLTTLDDHWRFLRTAQEITLELDLNRVRTRLESARQIVRSEHPNVPLDLPTLITDALGIRQAGACVTSIDPKSAAQSVLEVGDCLLEVDGARHSLAVFFNQRLRYRPETAKRIKVLRAGREVDVELKLRRETHTDPLAGEVKFWQLGFTLSSLSRTGSMVSPEMVNNHERLAFSWFKTQRRVFSEIERGTYSLLGLFSGRVQATQLSGPITIFYLAGRQAEAGWIPFLNLMVLISISIALLNLMPIPGLDGGHIMFASLEMIMRRPLPSKYRAMIQIMGVLMIFTLMLFALGSDLVRMWRISGG